MKKKLNQLGLTPQNGIFQMLNSQLFTGEEEKLNVMFMLRYGNRTLTEMIQTSDDLSGVMVALETIKRAKWSNIKDIITAPFTTDDTSFVETEKIIRSDNSESKSKVYGFNDSVDGANDESSTDIGTGTTEKTHSITGNRVNSVNDERRKAFILAKESFYDIVFMDIIETIGLSIYE